MIVPGHDDAAETLGCRSDAKVVCGHDDLSQRPGLLATLDYMLNERFARDQMQGFAWEPCGRKAGRDDTNDSHGREGLQGTACIMSSIKAKATASVISRTSYVRATLPASRSGPRMSAELACPRIWASERRMAVA